MLCCAPPGPHAGGVVGARRSPLRSRDSALPSHDPDTARDERIPSAAFADADEG